MLLDRYRSTRERTLALCKPLEIEDFVPQSAPFASPPKWHLAHTTWFFEEMILVHYLDGYRRFNDAFRDLFNSYYLGLGTPSARSHRGVMTRPTVQEIFKYRQYVDQRVADLLENKNHDRVSTLIELGINHEQQHQELLLTDLMHTFSLNPLKPAYDPDWSAPKHQDVEQGWINIDEGLYQVGNTGDEFCFDNELDTHKVYLNGFRIAKCVVKNGDWLTFINEGGYHRPEFWLDDGWEWLKSNKVQAPLYWREKDGEWFNFTLAGEQPLNPNSPSTHISFYEANAYAAWKKLRLPTEFEWEAAAKQINWGQCWEWTASSYQPYPNFRISPDAVGEYNGKFMANQYVLRGASPLTAPGHSRISYRNFFHPQHQWQFSGLRLAC